MENEALDINHLNKWLGNIETVTDYLTPIVEQRYRATLNIDPGDPKIGEHATSGLHWMLGWDLKKMMNLVWILILQEVIFCLQSHFQEECGQAVRSK